MNTPSLRFKEFSGMWEYKKFKEIFKINQGLQIAISERYTEQIEGAMFYITNEFLRKNSKSKYFIKNPPKSVICQEDDILMTRTGNTGQVVTGVEGAFHNNFFKVDFNRENYNSKYIFYVLKLDKIHNKIIRLAGSSTIPDLNHSDFYSIEIDLPSLPEQNKIASFLSLVDKRIELQEEKINKLELYKKGMMQQIFNQEIRFKDDDGKDYPEWEVKKMGDIGGTFNGLSGKTAKDFENGNSLYISYMEVFKNPILKEATSNFVDVSETENQNKLLKGDIIFTQSSETINEIAMSAVWLNDCINPYLNSFCFGYRLDKPTLNFPEFFAYLLRSDKARKRIVKEGQGSTRFNMSPNRLMGVSLQIPKSVKEQNKIADFLSSVDLKIEKENMKQNQLNELKKGLLQQMFV